MKAKFEYYEQLLRKKFEQEHYKQLRCIVPLDELPSISEDGSALINFSSNDFLGLSEHSHIKKNTIHYVLRWGAGSSSSRFVPEQLESQKKIEQKLSALIGSENCLLFSSDYQTHTLSLSALGSPKTQIFIDKHCKSSLFYGSYQSKSEVFRFDHNDLEHLEEILASKQSDKPHSQIVVVESIFQYGGDYAPLSEIIKLTKKYNAILYVDDSNSVGVEGVDGMGLCSQRKDIDFTVGTFGKSCGAYGAFLGCNHLMKDYLLHFNPTISSLNSLPPAALGAIDAALDLIPDMDQERKQIKEFSKTLRNILTLSKLDLINSDSHIICARFENEKNLKAFFLKLSQKNIITSIIKPPQHLRGGSLISFIVSALLSKEDVKTLSKLLNQEALIEKV